MVDVLFYLPHLLFVERRILRKLSDHPCLFNGLGFLRVVVSYNYSREAGGAAGRSFRPSNESDWRFYCRCVDIDRSYGRQDQDAFFPQGTDSKRTVARSLQHHKRSRQ